MFLGSALLVLVIKAIMVLQLKGESDYEFKERQRLRVKRQFLAIVIVQTLTYLLLFTRYIQSCKTDRTDRTDGELIVSLDYLAYTGLKILYMIVLTVALARLTCTTELLKAYKTHFAIAYGCMALTLAKDIASVYLFYRN